MNNDERLLHYPECVESNAWLNYCMCKWLLDCEQRVLRKCEEAVLEVVREIDKDEMRWVFQGLKGER